jgi:hypothetical protein
VRAAKKTAAKPAAKWCQRKPQTQRFKDPGNYDSQEEDSSDCESLEDGQGEIVREDGSIDVIPTGTTDEAQRQRCLDDMRTFRRLWSDAQRRHDAILLRHVSYCTNSIDALI